MFSHEHSARIASARMEFVSMTFEALSRAASSTREVMHGLFRPG